MKRINSTSAHRIALATITIAAFVVAAHPAFALGGLDKAKSAADDIKTGLYQLAGVVAAIYLLFLAFMAFAEKKSWSDFGMGVVYVAVVGGLTQLVTWAWAIFQ